MRTAGAVHRPRFPWPRIRRETWEHAGVLAIALVLGLLIGEMNVNPQRRLIVFLAGVSFTAAVYAVPAVLSLSVLVFLLPFGVKIVVGNTNVIFIILLAIVFLLRQVRSPERLDSGSRVWIPMILLLGVHAASMYNVAEGDDALALMKMVGLGSAMLLCYLVVAMVRDVPTLKLIVFVSIASCVATCAFACYEFLHPGHAILPKFFYAPWASRKSMFRAVSTFGNYSNYAQYLAINLVIMGFLFQRARSGLSRTLLMGAIALAGAIFLTSGMRGAFAALLLAGLYLLVFARHAVRIREFAGLAVIIAGVMAAASVVLVDVVGTGTIFTRFQQLGATGGSAEARLSIAQHMLSHVPDHILVGHGPAIRLPETFTAVLSSNNPHNQYIYYLYTVGIIGLLCFLGFMGRLAFEGHRTLVKTRRADPFALGLLAVLQGNLILFIFHEMFDDYMFSPLAMQVTWFYFGLLIATARLVRKTAVVR